MAILGSVRETHAAAQPSVVGQVQRCGGSAFRGWCVGGTVSTTVGDSVARPNCIVTRQEGGPRRRRRTDLARPSQILISLSCGAPSDASAASPRRSLASPQGRAAAAAAASAEAPAPTGWAARTGRGQPRSARVVAAQRHRVAEGPMAALALGSRSGLVSDDASRWAGRGLGQLAQPRGLIDRLTDHGVLEALLGADVARHRLARRHADAGLALGRSVADPPGDGAAGRAAPSSSGSSRWFGRAEYRQCRRRPRTC